MLYSDATWPRDSAVKAQRLLLTLNMSDGVSLLSLWIPSVSAEELTHSHSDREHFLPSPWWGKEKLLNMAASCKVTREIALGEREYHNWQGSHLIRWSNNSSAAVTFIPAGVHPLEEIFIHFQRRTLPFIIEKISMGRMFSSAWFYSINIFHKIKTKGQTERCVADTGFWFPAALIKRLLIICPT